jgi:hypothetical protein
MPKDAPPNGGAPPEDGLIGPRQRVSEMPFVRPSFAFPLDVEAEEVEPVTHVHHLGLCGPLFAV